MTRVVHPCWRGSGTSVSVHLKLGSCYQWGNDGSVFCFFHWHLCLQFCQMHLFLLKYISCIEFVNYFPFLTIIIVLLVIVAMVNRTVNHLSIFFSFPVRGRFFLCRESRITTFLTCWAESSTGSGTVSTHFGWKRSRSTPAVEISGHSAGLDGHQIPPHTCNNLGNHCTIIFAY